MRVGHGHDVHRFGGDKPLVLAGQVLLGEPGVEATSDGDVVVHAIIDAMLGAAALGDLGSLFPARDERWEGAHSLEELLPVAVRALDESGWSVASVDVTVIVQHVRIAPHRLAMREALAVALGIETGAVSVKATTTDKLGAIGRGEGIAVSAVVVAGAAEEAK